MVALKSYNDFIARIGNGYTRMDPFYGEHQSATTLTLFTGQVQPWQRTAWAPAVPGSLPSGVTAFLPVSVGLASSSAGFIGVYRAFPFGSLDISTNTYTAGSAMPTQTVGGTSTAMFGALLCEASVALNATPGSLTVTYDNQDGTSHSTSATAMTASAAVTTCGFIPLASGDYGVRNVTGASRTGGTTPTGTIKFWGLLPVANVTPMNGGSCGARNLLTSAPFPPRMLAGEQLIILAPATTARAVTGVITYVGDS